MNTFIADVLNEFIYQTVKTFFFIIKYPHKYPKPIQSVSGFKS